jgi:hypothetical protein
MTALASPQTIVQETPAVPAAPKRRGRRRKSELPQTERVRMAMYFSPEGELHHARCRQALQFRGVRAEIEGDFWCNACHEHVAVPAYAVAQIPFDTGEETPTTVLRLVS